MNILNSSDINILDLPDEILRFIFNKLNTIDMFYSLVGVNQRFDRLAFDSVYIHHLNFVIKRSDMHNSSVDVHILDKICSKILPRINEKVTELTVDPFSMEHILGTVHYPQLHSLYLVNYQPDILSQHLSGGTIPRLLIDQITHLTADIYFDKTEISNENDSSIFVSILFFGRYLNTLIFSQRSSNTYLTFLPWNIPHTSSLSSTLTSLRIKVNTFDDCLQLLNGCLQSLSTLIIRVSRIKRSLSNIDNRKKLGKLKSFSLTTDWHTYFYDTQIVPLLRRMLNLEELGLQLSVIRTESTYIDGNQLYDEVFNYMPQLNNFMFNIHTHIMNSRLKIDIPSNNDIRNSFIKRGFQSIDTCADDKLVNNSGNCHIYSLPYHYHDFLFMSSCFQGGKFDKVRTLLMRDQRPFEYKLFKIISQDFPFLQTLILLNYEPQNNEQHDSSTLMTFNHLFTLNLINAHSDYAIQFLSDRNTRLPCLTNLKIEYEILATVTNYFTNDTTRLNCAKIKSLVTCQPFARPQNFDLYFPSL